MTTLEELKASFSINIDTMIKENNKNVINSFSNALDIYLSTDRDGNLVLRSGALSYDKLCTAEDAVQHEVDVESKLMKRIALNDIVDEACKVHEPDPLDTHEEMREAAKERAESLATALEKAAVVIRGRAAQI
jgi:hypothetical protein